MKFDELDKMSNIIKYKGLNVTNDITSFIHTQELKLRGIIHALAQNIDVCMSCLTNIVQTSATKRQTILLVNVIDFTSTFL